MRRFTVLGLAAFLTPLALAGVAGAQGAQPGQLDQAPQQGMQGGTAAQPQALHQQPMAQPGIAQPLPGQALPGGEIRQFRATAAVGTVQGTVLDVDFANGLVRISSAGSPIVLRAVPNQLADLNPGDLVALTYNNYAGQRWIVPYQGLGSLGSAGPGTFAQFGTLTGYVSAVNKSTGQIVVRGQQFRVHPEALERIIPGQFVSVSYENIQNVPWATGIFPAGAAGGQMGGSAPMGGAAQSGTQSQ